MNDDDLKELAYSAYEEAMSFGLSHETFLRYFKTIRDRAAPPVATPGKLKVTLQDSPYERMFSAAVYALAEISMALGIPAEDAATANGNALILEAIADLQKARSRHGSPCSEGSEPDEKDTDASNPK